MYNKENYFMVNKLKKYIPLSVFKAFQPAYHFLVAWLAAYRYKFPSRRLIIIGVTGTAGKTSTAYLIMKMLSEAGYKTGLSSTAVFSDGDKEWLNDKKMTMPGRFFIQEMLSRMLKNHCRYAVVETTSEGIKQFRHRFINYDILVFTNLYPEHLESHGSFENYQAAKGALFAHLKRCKTKYIDEDKIVVEPKSEYRKLDLSRVQKTIIVNGDDKFASYFLNYYSEAKIVYTTKTEKDINSYLKLISTENITKDFSLVKGTEITPYEQGTSIKINGEVINLNLLGDYNALNALAAYTVGLNQKIDPLQLKQGLESVMGLAGKLEFIRVESESSGITQNFTAIVDYSFEPKALTKLYETVKKLKHNRIIHVLGSAGGGRDKARRPILGRMAAENADIIIITNEDPYDEDPASIINEVAAGAEELGRELNTDLFKIFDRQEAVKKALELAESGDLVLFTGKGAEQYICMANDVKIPWDEREVVRSEIRAKLSIDSH